MLTRRILLTATAGTLLTPPLATTASARTTAATAARSTASASAWGSTPMAAPGRSPATGDSPVELRFPRPSGRFPVGTNELHLVDRDRDDPFVPGRPRELMISIWYPSANSRSESAAYLPPLTAQMYAEGAAGALQQPLGTIDWAGAQSHAGLLAPVSRAWGRRPVVLFSPGFGVPRGLGSVMVAELASRGYVVVTVDHTFECAGVEFPGRRLEVQTLPAGGHALMARETRLADARFVLDALAELVAGRNPDAGKRRLPAGLGQLLDLSRIGAFGHSAGGVTSADLLVADHRVRAGINLDGPVGYGYPDPATSPTVAKGTHKPFLLVGAGGTGPGGGPLSHRTDRSLGLFWDHSTGWKRDLNVPNGMHYTFVDHQLLIPWFQRFFTVPPELVANTIGDLDHADRIFRSLRTYLPAFFDQHLRNIPSPLWTGDSPRHPDYRFIP